MPVDAVATGIWGFLPTTGAADPGSGLFTFDTLPDPGSLVISTTDRDGTIHDFTVAAPGDLVLLRDTTAGNVEGARLVVATTPTTFDTWAMVPVIVSGASPDITQPWWSQPVLIDAIHYTDDPSGGGPYVTATELAEQLGYPPGNPRFERVVIAASDQIDATIGRTARLDPAPEAIVEICLSLAVDWWKQPDATFGVIGLNETGPVRISRDLIARYMDRLVPWMEPAGWGIA